MGEQVTERKSCQGRLLDLVSVVLIGGGVFVLITSYRTLQLGVADVFLPSLNTSKTQITATAIVSGVTIVLAAVYASARARMCRIVEIGAAVGAAALAVFFVVSISSLETPFISDMLVDGNPLSVDFNRGYCVTQGASLCDSVDYAEARATFFANTTATNASLASFTDLRGVNAMCAAFQDLVSELSPVCASCKAIGKTTNASTGIALWAADQGCPSTNDGMEWCGLHFATLNEVAIKGSPFGGCAVDLYFLAPRITERLIAGEVTITAATLLLVVVVIWRVQNEYPSAAMRHDASYVAAP